MVTDWHADDSLDFGGNPKTGSEIWRIGNGTGNMCLNNCSSHFL